MRDLNSFLQMYDAQQALGFVTNQSHVINRRVYETRYPDLDYGRLIYVDTSSPEWSGGIDTYISDMAGAAAWYTGGAKDIPLADVNMAMVEHSFHMAAIGYEYNLEEVGKAQFLGIQLSARRALAAKRAYEQFMWNLALFGDTSKGKYGLLNSNLVSSGNVAADGTGTSTYWADKTPAQIVRDINTVITPIWTGSLYIEMADTVLLPHTDLLYLGQTPYSSTTMETLLSFVQKTNAYTLQTGRPLTIRGVLGLENAGASNKGRMVGYRNSEEVAKLHVPMPHRFLPVWQNGPLNFVVPGIFRTGGTEILLPNSIRYADAISA